MTACYKIPQSELQKGKEVLESGTLVTPSALPKDVAKVLLSEMQDYKPSKYQTLFVQSVSSAIPHVKVAYGALEHFLATGKTAFESTFYGMTHEAGRFAKIADITSKDSPHGYALELTKPEHSFAVSKMMKWLTANEGNKKYHGVEVSPEHLSKEVGVTVEQARMFLESTDRVMTKATEQFKQAFTHLNTLLPEGKKLDLSVLDRVPLYVPHNWERGFHSAWVKHIKFKDGTESKISMSLPEYLWESKIHPQTDASIASVSYSRNTLGQDAFKAGSQVRQTIEAMKAEGKVQFSHADELIMMYDAIVAAKKQNESISRRKAGGEFIKGWRGSEASVKGYSQLMTEIENYANRAYNANAKAQAQVYVKDIFKETFEKTPQLTKAANDLFESMSGKSSVVDNLIKQVDPLTSWIFGRDFIGNSITGLNVFYSTAAYKLMNVPQLVGMAGEHYFGTLPAMLSIASEKNVSGGFYKAVNAELRMQKDMTPGVKPSATAQKVLREGAERGVLSPSFLKDLGPSYESKTRKFGQHAELASSTLYHTTGSSVFATVDQYGRAQTLLSMYHYLRDSGLSHELAMNRAGAEVMKIHTETSRANSPEMFRKLGQASKIVFPATKWMVSYLNKADEHMRAIAKAQGFGKKMYAASGAATFFGIRTLVIGLGGVAGLEMYNTIADKANEWFGTEMPSWQDVIEAIAAKQGGYTTDNREAVMNDIRVKIAEGGLGRVLVGLDFNPQFSAPGSLPIGANVQWAFNTMSAANSAAHDLTTMGVIAPDTLSAIKSVAPRSTRYSIEKMTMTEDDTSINKRGKEVIPTSVNKFGFSVPEVSRYQQMERSRQQQSRNMATRVQSVMDDATKAIITLGDIPDNLYDKMDKIGGDPAQLDKLLDSYAKGSGRIQLEKEYEQLLSKPNKTDIDEKNLDAMERVLDQLDLVANKK